MKRTLRYLIILIVVGTSLHTGSTAQQKLAQSGMKWLSVGMDARASGMSGAMTAVDGNSSAMFYNPAGMARLATFTDLTAGRTMWIADINYSYASLAIAPMEGQWGVIGVSVQSVDYGDFIGTIGSPDPANTKQYTETGTFSPTAVQVGLGYANALSERFSIGGAVKYVRQNLGGGYLAVTKTNDVPSDYRSYQLSVLAFDFGVLYNTGFKNLKFGMSIRNFSKEISYIEENFQLPLTFRIGLSMNMLGIFDVDPKDQRFMLSFDAEHSRDFPEQIRIGGEYYFMDLVALRGGYITGADEEGISLGVGASKDYNMDGGLIGADYAYTPFGVFGTVHRFSLHLTF